MKTTYGPTFRWFAWRPVFTRDRGWRWLRMVNRHRVFYDDADFAAAGSYFECWVEEV